MKDTHTHAHRHDTHTHDTHTHDSHIHTDMTHLHTHTHDAHTHDTHTLHTHIHTHTCLSATTPVTALVRETLQNSHAQMSVRQRYKEIRRLKGGKGDLSHVKTDLSFLKRDLLHVKTDLSYVKRDLFQVKIDQKRPTD